MTWSLPSIAVPPSQALSIADVPPDRSTTSGLLADVVVAETVYVLKFFYEAPRASVASAIRALLAMPTVRTVDRDVLVRAVDVYEVDRLDFAEAYLVACAESTGVGTVASFDRSIDRVTTVRRIEPR